MNDEMNWKKYWCYRYNGENWVKETPYVFSENQFKPYTFYISKQGLEPAYTVEPNEFGLTIIANRYATTGNPVGTTIVL